jgi:hypothetical protein
VARAPTRVAIQRWRIRALYAAQRPHCALQASSGESRLIAPAARYWSVANASTINATTMMSSRPSGASCGQKRISACRNRRARRGDEERGSVGQERDRDDVEQDRRVETEERRKDSSSCQHGQRAQGRRGPIQLKDSMWGHEGVSLSRATCSRATCYVLP